MSSFGWLTLRDLIDANHASELDRLLLVVYRGVGDPVEGDLSAA
jgi:hypothetical protein